MIPAGKKRELIIFEAATIERGASGVKKAASWASAGSRFAFVSLGTGSERREAAIESATQVGTFTVLADALAESITAGGHRISWDGLAWDIAGIARRREANRPAEIEFTATAKRG